jgi:hypothetical protein
MVLAGGQLQIRDHHVSRFELFPVLFASFFFLLNHHHQVEASMTSEAAAGGMTAPW